MKLLVALCCACCISGAVVAALMHFWPILIANAALALVAAGLWGHV